MRKPKIETGIPIPNAKDFNPTDVYRAVVGMGPNLEVGQCLTMPFDTPQDVKDNLDRVRAAVKALKKDVSGRTYTIRQTFYVTKSNSFPAIRVWRTS